MWIHYDNEASAVAHLQSNGWELCKSGYWVSKDGACKASIHSVRGVDLVAICYTEIERVA